MRGEEDDEEEWGALLILSWSNERLVRATPQRKYPSNVLLLWSPGTTGECVEQADRVLRQPLLCLQRAGSGREEDRRNESRRLRLELSNYGSSGLQSLYQCQSRASSSHLERLFFSPPPTRKTHSLTPKAITLLFSLPPLSLPLPLLSISLFLSPSLSLFVYCERCIKLKVCRLRAWSAWANHWSGWNYDWISAKQVHENLLCSRSSIGNHRGM